MGAEGRGGGVALGSSIIDIAKSWRQDGGWRLFTLANVPQSRQGAVQRALMENRGYIRIFKLSRLAFLPKSASECDSQQRAAMFDYADQDAQDQRGPDLTAGLTPLTCSELLPPPPLP